LNKAVTSGAAIAAPLGGTDTYALSMPVKEAALKAPMDVSD
jgi:hypothetical protein